MHPLNAENLFLKDGSIIKGKVVNETATEVLFSDEQKKVTSYPRKNVLRIIYGNLKLGKKYIQRVEGESLTAFLVDEDSDVYIFRKDLHKPDELTLNRNEVHFMTEKNPTGLKIDGKIEPDRISVKWLHPYTAVKKYNIYIKNEKTDKFEFLDTTRFNQTKFENLAPGTTYYIYVTAVDNDNYESLPSNELKMTTIADADKKSGNKDNKNKSENNKITMLKYITQLPSGIRLAYNLGIPFTSLFKEVYSDLHGVDLTYSFFFNNIVSFRTGLNLQIGYKPTEDANALLSSFNIGLNFGYPVIGFIYPYAGFSIKGIWINERSRLLYYNFGGMGVDGNIGIAFTILNFFGLYIEYTAGWAMVFDKSRTDISSMSIKTGLYFRF